MARKHQTEERKASGDKVFTPEWAARDMVDYFKPTGKILEPCRGDGAIWQFLDDADWCELDEGIDFLNETREYDWIISNPPYSQTRPFMRKAMELSKNFVFLVPARNIVSGYGTVREAHVWGGMKHIRWYGTGSRLNFPMGNAIAAYHWEKDYRGPTYQTYYEDDIPLLK